MVVLVDHAAEYLPPLDWELQRRGAHRRPGEIGGHGLPADLVFRTKGQLAIDICADAFAEGARFDFICGDEVYGARTQLREFFEAPDLRNGQRDLSGTFWRKAASADWRAGLGCRSGGVPVLQRWRRRCGARAGR